MDITRRNSLSRDVCSPVEDHDLVPSLPDNLKSQTHSRVSECDAQPSVQVQPSAVDRMITASTDIQTDLSKVVHPSYRSICHSSEPQTSTVRVSSPRSKGLERRCTKHKLDGSQQRSDFSYQCQQLFSNSPTIMYFTAIHNISTSTPSI